MPHFLAALSADKIAKLRLLYEDHSITLIHICTQFEVSYYQLQKLAKTDKWKPRPPNRKSGARSPKQAKNQLVMLKRMQLIAKRHVENLEQSLETTDRTSSSSDRDKDARTLRTLIKIIEEINGLSNEMSASKVRNDASIEQDKFGTEQRRELTKRLKALRCKT